MINHVSSSAFQFPAEREYLNYLEIFQFSRRLQGCIQMPPMWFVPIVFAVAFPPFISHHLEALTTDSLTYMQKTLRHSRLCIIVNDLSCTQSLANALQQDIRNLADSGKEVTCVPWCLCSPLSSSFSFRKNMKTKTILVGNLVNFACLYLRRNGATSGYYRLVPRPYREGRLQ